MLLFAGAAAIVFCITLAVDTTGEQSIESPAPASPNHHQEPRGKTSVRLRAASNASETALLKQQLAFLKEAMQSSPPAPPPPPPPDAPASPALTPATSVAPAPAADVGAPEPTTPDEQWCRSHHERHRVRPGVGWGSLSKLQRQEWMNRKCDQYFCQPHEKAGRGVYKCVPKKDR